MGWQRDADTAPTKGLCKYLGDRGVYVVNFNYRLTATAGQGWPSQWQDAQLVVRWLRKGGYARVGFVGLSAGGYNALGIAFTQNTIVWAPTDPLREAWLYTKYTSLPDFVVALSPFSDLNDPKLNPVAIERLTEGVFGAQPDIAASTLNSIASPITHVHSNIPSLLVIHGLNDHVVPVQESQALFQAMTSIGGKNMRLMLTNGGHLLVGLTTTQEFALYKQILNCAKGVASSVCALKPAQ